MRSLNYKEAYQKLLTPEIVSCLAQIHEQKGQQNLFIQAHEDALSELPEIAKIQSTEASNRIEGIITTDDRLKKIVRNKTTPRNRNEREIAGYRDVLITIHENYDFIPIRPGMILQLHRDLYKFSNPGFGGNGGSYKNSDNIMAEEMRDGTGQIRFQPVSAWETPEAMETLCNEFNKALKDPNMDPLLLMFIFILDFLCIHPFNDGNGRMSRLLTLLILYRSGYFVGKYISLEKLIADNRESYYEALQESGAGWQEEGNDYLPFVRYMLGIIIVAYRDFTNRIQILVTKGLSKSDRVKEIIRDSSGKMTKAEMMALCPDVSERTVQRTLTSLMESGEIIKIGGGRYTFYI